jgi:hypothetical protein
LNIPIIATLFTTSLVVATHQGEALVCRSGGATVAELLWLDLTGSAAAITVHCVIVVTLLITNTTAIATNGLTDAFSLKQLSYATAIVASPATVEPYFNSTCG